MNIKNKIKNLIQNKHFILIMISITATIPILFFSSVPAAHDILFHLSRIKGINYELLNNNLYSAIYHNFINNLGYASPLFYPDIFLYPFSIIYRYTNLVFTHKILIFSLNIITVYVIDFIASKYIKDQKTVYIFDILYIFFSYRMIDLYIRGAIGEVLAFIFIPFIVLGLKEIVHGEKNNYYYLIIGMTGLIYSHLISTLLGGIYIFVYLLLNIKYLFKEKRFLYFLKAVLITSLLSISFLVPLVEQLIDRNFYIYNLGTLVYENIGVPVYRLFLAMSLPSTVWYPLGIGLIFVIIIFFGFKYFKKIHFSSKTFLFLGLLFLFSSTNLVPQVIYDKFLYLIQYNWRFYLLATISLFFFLLEIYQYLNMKEQKIIYRYSIIFIIIILAYTTSIGLIFIKFDKLEQEYLGYYEYLPENITYEDVKNETIKDSCNNDINYQVEFIYDKTYINYTDNNYDDTVITLPLLYYKGYKSNNSEIINNNGLVSIKLSNESGKVIVYYDITDITLYSRIISLITFMFIVVHYIRKKNNMTN